MRAVLPQKTRKKEHGKDDVDTIKAAKKASSLAKENNNENVLPEWIKNQKNDS